MTTFIKWMWFFLNWKWNWKIFCQRCNGKKQKCTKNEYNDEKLM